MRRVDNNSDIAFVFQLNNTQRTRFIARCLCFLEKNICLIAKQKSPDDFRGIFVILY